MTPETIPLIFAITFITAVVGGGILGFISDCRLSKETTPWKVARYAAYILLGFDFLVIVSVIIKCLIMIILG